jgi:hypothetical protein
LSTSTCGACTRCSTVWHDAVRWTSFVFRVSSSINRRPDGHHESTCTIAKDIRLQSIRVIGRISLPYLSRPRVDCRGVSVRGAGDLLSRTLSVCVVLVTKDYTLYFWTSPGRILPTLFPAPSDTLSRYNIDTISPVFLS